jgi:hypothetical protein
MFPHSLIIDAVSNPDHIEANVGTILHNELDMILTERIVVYFRYYPGSLGMIVGILAKVQIWQSVTETRNITA